MNQIKRNIENGRLNNLKDLILNGVTDKEIARSLGRPYWGMVDKIRRLRKEDRL